MYNSADITILNKIIKDDTKVDLIDDFNKKKVTLTETDNINYSVTIKGIPDDTLVIKTDVFDAPKSLFQGEKGECKRCDYVIIYDTDKQKVILFIEMKAGKGINKEIIQQLKGGKCLVKYCQQIGIEFWEEKDFLSDYDYRFISFKKINLGKKPTREKKPQKLHNSPENMLKISSQKIVQFKQLIGNY